MWFDAVTALRQLRQDRNEVRERIAKTDAAIAAMEALVIPVAHPRCPLCGSMENCADLGGGERCFHCRCGFLQCTEDYPALEPDKELIDRPAAAGKGGRDDA